MSRTGGRALKTSTPGGRELRGSTPLVGAVLSSNWVLFEAIYDKYEGLTRRKWSRDEVREIVVHEAAVMTCDQLNMLTCGGCHFCKS